VGSHIQNILEKSIFCQLFHTMHFAASLLHSHVNVTVKTLCRTEEAQFVCQCLRAKIK
jgi:hypothetical protein